VPMLPVGASRCTATLSGREVYMSVRSASDKGREEEEEGGRGGAASMPVSGRAGQVGREDTYYSPRYLSIITTISSNREIV
jgi:hypothetical protein